MLHFMDPHYPYMNGLRRGRPILLGSEVHRSRGPALASSLRGAYLGDVAFMDRHLGRLFAGLRELGLYDESVVVFTSDHGEELFEHQAWGHGESLYREVVEIPLLIKAPRSAARPDRGPADARPSEGARQIDIAPTLLDLASMPIPTGMQGLALLRDPGGESPPRRDVCHSSLDRTYNRLESLRTPTTTYILATRTNQPRIEPVELYDRKADPEERTNRAATAMALRRTLDAQLERIRAAWPAAASEGETMQLDRELEAQMRALGYHDPRD
jgi:arylsulfatase A-like enzyme